MKKFATMAISILLIACMVAGGSLAYLTSEDSDVNVMTLGNVEIEQIEQQRILDENGNIIDSSKLIGNLEDFEDNKPAYPYTGKGDVDSNVPWDETRGFDLYKTTENVVDKIVTVKNTGTSPAYVRTLIAFEVGTEAEKAVKYVANKNATDWNWEPLGVAKIGETNYDVFVATYDSALAAGETTLPSLLQAYLDSSATNEDMDRLKVEGEENATWEILVLSQAVQTAGFETAGAAVALDDAFGAVATCYADWLGGVVVDAAGDIWDGTADTSWYNDTDTEFVIMTAEQLAGFAQLVDGGNTFEGKTVKLGKNIDLAAVDADGNKIGFNPIGHSSNGKSFNGTFDGQGYTISNMYEQNDLGAWQYEGEYYGLFAYTNSATIKNLTVADAYISSGRNEAAGVVGNAVDTTFSDITISNVTLIAYNNSAGGVASECYGDCSFTDITVDDKTVIGPLWGTYDVRLGGVVGMVKSTDNVTFKNVSVACKLDAINDVAANYQYWLYRYSGMLIGQVDGVNGVADPTGYVTCENVTVTYGDWVNYHYCEDAALGAGSYNGPGEYKYARVEAGTGTDGIDLSTCNHNADESHNVLIVFDQLFGGGQGVSGLKTYDGVTVNYNN